MNRIIAPPEEYSNRIKRTQQSMISGGYDLIIAFSTLAEPSYSRYFADYTPAFETAGIVIPVKGSAFLLVGPESKERAELSAAISNIKRMIEFREPATPRYEDSSFDTFEGIFKSVQESVELHRIGIAGFSILPHEIYLEIEDALRKTNVSAVIDSADDFIASLTVIKTDYEIACIRESARITRLAMQEAINEVRIGSSAMKVKGAALAKMYSEGGEGESFPGWISVNEATQFPISVCTNQEFKSGDFVQIEIGTRFQGYSSVIGRTVSIGALSSEAQTLVETVISAKAVVEDAFRTAESSEDVAKKHRDYLIANGKESWMAYGPCHGTGICECELPWIEVGNEFRLEKNMVFCMDIFLADQDNRIGARYEDMVLIGNDGPEYITDFGNSIIVV